jgi:low affinity Fe/Cu permease
MNLAQRFTQFANATARATGRPLTFVACCAIVVIWAAGGPLFGFSDTWQLVINTGTTIITFLMVFLIQNTQNRDSAAIQVKLDELLRSHRPASNDFIGVEHLTEDELEELRARCEAQAKVVRQEAAKKRKTGR